MILNKKKIINLLFFSSIIFFLLQGFLFAEWITKKSDTSKELLKVDDMYSKGYLTKNECTKMKSKLLKISDATGMCDDVIIVVENKENNIKSYDWMAEVKHPKTNKIFSATRLSTKKKAINLAIKKCYAYVSKSLNKRGYNDCYVSKSINVKDNNTNETYKISKIDDKNDLGAWTAVVEHKEKNIFYTSKTKSLKQDAINDAISQCWFDWRHKEGDWPSENCVTISVKNKEITSSFITKKDKKKKKGYITKKDKKKKKDLSKKLITKKEKDKNHYQKIKDLPNGQYYFVAFGLNDLKIIGYVNSDPSSKKITSGNQEIIKTNIGSAYINDQRSSCDVISEIEDVVSSYIFRGNAILDCKNKGKFFGSWIQQKGKGEGIGIDNDGNQLKFYFVDNKIDAFNIKSPFIEFAKNEISIIEQEYTPKKGIVNKAPIIKIDLEKKIKPGSYKIAGIVMDNEQKDPPYLYIDDEKVEVNKDGSFDISMFTLNDTEVTVLAVDKRGEQKEVILKVSVEKQIATIEKLQKLNPQKIKTKKSKDRLAVIIGIEKYVSIQNAAYAKSDAEYFTEYAKRAFGIEDKNIKTLIDDQADYISSKKALFKWLRQRINKNQTEIFIFYSGHGLASLDDEELFLLTSDSDGDFIEDTALSRTNIIDRIASFNPKSVTMFIDACYSGETRDSEDDELLIASAKPLIKLKDDSKLPNNFNMFSASQISQASSSTKKETGVKNGIFSYYLMKGLEGGADLNKDRKITNGELYEYLSTNVPRIARSLHNRQQEPFFKGDVNSILVKF